MQGSTRGLAAEDGLNSRTDLKRYVHVKTRWKNKDDVKNQTPRIVDDKGTRFFEELFRSAVTATRRLGKLSRFVEAFEEQLFLHVSVIHPLQQSLLVAWNVGDKKATVVDRRDEWRAVTEDDREEVKRLALWIANCHINDELEILCYTICFDWN